MHYKMRNGEADDLNLILNSWLKTYRDSKQCFNIESSIYYKYQEAKIRSILKKCEVLIAQDMEDPSHIFGYICYDPNIISNVCVVHYIYIKKPFRTLGIFKDLLDCAMNASKHHESMPLVVTHDTFHFHRAYKPFYVFNPYIAGNN